MLHVFGVRFKGMIIRVRARLLHCLLCCLPKGLLCIRESNARLEDRTRVRTGARTRVRVRVRVRARVRVRLRVRVRVRVRLRVQGVGHDSKTCLGVSASAICISLKHSERGCLAETAQHVLHLQDTATVAGTLERWKTVAYATLKLRVRATVVIMVRDRVGVPIRALQRAPPGCGVLGSSAAPPSEPCRALAARHGAPAAESTPSL